MAMLETIHLTINGTDETDLSELDQQLLAQLKARVWQAAYDAGFEAGYEQGYDDGSIGNNSEKGLEDFK